MKKTFCLFCVALLIGALTLCNAFSETLDIADIEETNVSEPLTWTYLATIAGSAAFTLLIVQFLKVPLDKVWKIPTRVFAYFVALVIMLIATAFTTGLTTDNALLVAANAFLAATSAYGAYECTFAKHDK